MKSYIKIYENYFGIKWDRSKYEIHHIDRNRENNEIGNLILLPKKLHTNYHKVRIYTPNTFDVKRFDWAAMNGWNDADYENLAEYFSVMKEVKKWGYLKLMRYRYSSGNKIEDFEEFISKWL